MRAHCGSTRTESARDLQGSIKAGVDLGDSPRDRYCREICWLEVDQYEPSRSMFREGVNIRERHERSVFCVIVTFSFSKVSSVKTLFFVGPTVR